MKVRDVMTSEVRTVSPETSLKEVAEILATARISGLPVVEDGRVVGVVSEGDIVGKEAGEERRREGLLGWLLSGEVVAGKLEARTAAEAMTAPALTIEPEREVAEAARAMLERAVNRLPVVDDGGDLVGIVSRADLVRAFIRSDEEIERELREDVALRTLWLDPAAVQVTVTDGDVTLAGEVETRDDARLLEEFATRVPGVVAVRSELRWRVEHPRVPASDPRVPAPPRDR